MSSLAVPVAELCDMGEDYEGISFSFTQEEEGEVLTFSLDMRTPVGFAFAEDYKWWGKVFPLGDEANPFLSDAGIIAEKFSKTIN